MKEKLKKKKNDLERKDDDVYKKGKEGDLQDGNWE